jgi:hypothetical protein
VEYVGVKILAYAERRSIGDVSVFIGWTSSPEPLVINVQKLMFISAVHLHFA